MSRRILHLILLRYVDDYFGPDHAAAVESAKDVFARSDFTLPWLHIIIMFVCICRLVRACLGPSAISEKKLEAGNGLVILGVHVFTDQSPRENYGINLWPSQDKVQKWVGKIGLALATLKMTSGEASKLSGGLQWACQMAFRRLGRAMLRPIIDQIKYAFCTFDRACMYLVACTYVFRTRTGEVGKDLRLALVWWKKVLVQNLVQCIGWRVTDTRPAVHLYSDARAVPPRVAAVLFACA